MMVFRRYIGFVLVAALLLTGHSAAASRFQRDATGQVILCTGTGPVTVYVDENGVPTGPPHICPDCITHLFDLAVLPADLVAPEAQEWQVAVSALRAQWHRAATRSRRARAPPLV